MNEYANTMEQMELEYLDRNDKCGGIEYTPDEYEDSIRREEAEFEAHNLFDVDTPNYDDYLESIYNKENIIDKTKVFDYSTAKKDDNKIIKFPISSSEENMKDKLCDYDTLAIITLYSKFNVNEKDKGKRFIYKDKILLNKDEIENLSNKKIDTVIRNIKKLSKLESRLVEAKNTSKGIVYIINYEDEKNRKYVTIEEEILKTLVDACSKNLIKTYILLKYLCKDNPKIVTREYIAEQIGLSKVSRDNLKSIGRILKVLINMKLIKRNKINKVEVLENGNEQFKTYYEYSLVKYDDWLIEFNKED